MGVYVIETRIEDAKCSNPMESDGCYWELYNNHTCVPFNFYSTSELAEFDAKRIFKDPSKWRIISLSMSDMERNLRQAIEGE